MNAQLDAPAQNSIQHSAPPSPTPPPEKIGYLLLIFGVILPLATFGIENFTSMCAEIFFDPMPTSWHALLVLFVPAANLLAWWRLRAGASRREIQHGISNGLAIGFAGFYLLLYLPLTPFALFAIPLLGWGLLPLAPHFAFGAACYLRYRMRKLVGKAVPGFWPGLGLAALVLLAVNLPIPLTRYLMSRAVAQRTENVSPALRWLRTVGHEPTLLRDCYRQSRRGLPSLLDFGLMGAPVAPEDARKIYFQVTGRLLNSVPPPSRKWNIRSEPDWSTELMWTQEQGGEQVGGRINGLSLAQSKLDAVADADAGWSYTEWIMEFANHSSTPREARTQIRLPSRGVVSRVTLWINGEEREAAFAGRAEVREAYRKVAVVQRRDPVLVTTSGPDRVLLQCFPVPANGKMKVRIGVTAPLLVTNLDQAVMFLPAFAERNFGVPTDVHHQISVQSARKVRSGTLNGLPSSNGNFWQTEISQSDLAKDNRISIDRSARNRVVWSKDVKQPDQYCIQQTLKEFTPAPPNHLVIVLDGSATMQPYLAEVADALPSLPEGINLQILLVKDGVIEFSGPMAPADAGSLEKWAASLRRTGTVGGQDNLPGLIKAYEAAPDAVVLWVHGPQPILFNDFESVDQRLYWTRRQTTPNTPLLFDLPVEPGPNRVLEKLTLHRAYQAVPRLGTVTADLQRLFGAWRGDAPQWQWVRTRVPRDPKGPALENNRHVTRLWAFEEPLRLQESRDNKEAVRLAALHQLVTPLSGAVVLENQRQYDQAGLQPVASDSVPSVPEPKGLMAIGLIMLAGCLVFRHSRKAMDNG